VGDKLVGLNGKPVRSRQDVEDAIAGCGLFSSLVMRLARIPEGFVTITVPVHARGFTSTQMTNLRAMAAHAVGPGNQASLESSFKQLSIFTLFGEKIPPPQSPDVCSPANLSQSQPQNSKRTPASSGRKKKNRSRLKLKAGAKTWGGASGMTQDS